MKRRIPRRDFLKAAPAAAGMLAYVAQAPAPAPVGAVRRATATGYAIRPIAYSDVAVTDAFWKPKIDTNATVTIPFEFQKAGDGGRGVSTNVLQAAIYSLRTHPDASLQALVDARIHDLASGQGQRGSGNNLFEVASTCYTVTGKRELLDAAVKSADAIYDTFKRDNPPFSGGERDAINCIELYRVTGDKKHLDLARHYLDIRGLDNSVNRSRHNQSYKPVLEQSEAVGHAVNCASLMVSLVDVGVLSGVDAYFQAGSRMWHDAVARKYYVTGGIGSTGNEGFGEPYDLPNISAYSETCAALMFATLNHKLFLATGDGKYIDVLERNDLQQRHRRRVGVGRPLLLRQPPGQRRRRPRSALAEGVARMLPAQSGPVHGVDARVHLRAGTEGRDLRQPVSLERRLLFNRWQATEALGRERNALGRTIDDQGVGERGGQGHDQVESSRLGEKPSRAGRPLFVPGRDRAADSRLGERPDDHPGRRRFRLRLARSQLGRRRPHRDRVSFRREEGCRGQPCEAGPRPHRRRARTDRVLLSSGRIVTNIECCAWFSIPSVEWKASFDKDFYGGATVLSGEAREIGNPSPQPRPVKLIPYSPVGEPRTR